MLDVSGAAHVLGVTYVTNIAEEINAVTFSTAITCDYSQSSVFYIGSAPTANFTINLINMPSITNTSRSYVVTIAYWGATSNFYCNSASVSTSSSVNSTKITPNFSSTPTATVASGTHLVLQQLVYFYQATINGIFMSNIVVYNS